MRLHAAEAHTIEDVAPILHGLGRGSRSAAPQPHPRALELWLLPCTDYPPPAGSSLLPGRRP